MTNQTAKTITTNIVPVQAIFDVNGVCVGLVGPGGEFFSPPLSSDVISNATITNSTINSTTIGATIASTGIGSVVFVPNYNLAPGTYSYSLYGSVDSVTVGVATDALTTQLDAPTTLGWYDVEGNSGQLDASLIPSYSTSNQNYLSN